MSAGRITVGFHRLGIAAAVLPTLVGLFFVLGGAYFWLEPVIKPPKFRVTHEESGKAFVVVYGSGPIGEELKGNFVPTPIPDPVLDRLHEQMSEVDRSRDRNLTNILTGVGSLLLALGIYLAARLVGWVVAGFAGS
jgi:hypothetical protein